MTVEDESTLQRSFASQIPGVTFGPTGAMYANPPGPGSYATYNRPVAYDNGSGDLTAAWVLTAVSWVSAPIILSIIGLVMANKAIEKGNPGGQSAKTFAIVSLIIQCAGVFCFCGFPLLGVLAR
jgi:hypothetical protein